VKQASFFFNKFKQNYKLYFLERGFIMDWKILVFAYILPIVILIIAVVIVGLSIRFRNNIKDFLRIGKTVQTGLEVADVFLPDTKGFKMIKEMINDIVYSVEEISKQEHLSSEEKHALAKKLYMQALDDFDIKDSCSISDNLLNALIKGSVFIMNKTLLKEKTDQKEIEDKLLEILEDINKENDNNSLEDEIDSTEYNEEESIENEKNNNYVINYNVIKNYNEEDLEEPTD